jgi:hypothetical protein
MQVCGMKKFVLSTNSTNAVQLPALGTVDTFQAVAEEASILTATRLVHAYQTEYHYFFYK